MVDGKHPSSTWLVYANAVLLTLTAVSWALEVPFRLGLIVYDEQFLAAILGLALSLAFLSRVARGGSRPMTAIHIALTVAAVAVCGYIALEYPDFSFEMTFSPAWGIVLCAILVLLVIEGIRMTSGLSLMIVVVAFLAYALGRNVLPSPFGGAPAAPSRLAGYLAVDPNAILGSPLMIASTIVIAFIFMGQCLLRGGGAEFFRDISLMLLGRYRGGSGKIAIFSSMLFGLVSGSAVGNVVSTGVMTIGIMKRGGFKPQTAAAIEAVASTGGQILPPVLGATAFLMADFIRVPYSSIAIAALIPALLYFLSLYLSVDLKAALTGLAPVPQSEIPQARAVLASGWHVIIPLVVLVVTLFYFNMSPEFAAMLSAAGFIVNGFVFG